MPPKLEVTSAAALGAAIKRTRKTTAGLIQREAAFLCAVSPPFLNKLERGSPSVQLGKVLQVCQNLGIRIFLQLPGEEE